MKTEKISLPEIASDYAERKVKEYFSKEHPSLSETELEEIIYVEDEDSLSYTEEAQELFNSFYDEYYDIVQHFKIVDIEVVIEDNSLIPTRGSELAACWDVYANSVMKIYSGNRELSSKETEILSDKFKNKGFVSIKPFERMLIGTGIKLAKCPKNICITVRGRSGKALKEGLLVYLGTVDSDYRGEIGIILVNTTPYKLKINRGDRIAQLFIDEVIIPHFIKVDKQENTKRGVGGFGSTGK